LRAHIQDLEFTLEETSRIAWLIFFLL